MFDMACCGKRKDTGEWIYGYPVIDTAPCSLKASGKCKCPHDGTEAYIFTWDDDHHEYREYEVDASTISRYSNLEDSYKKRIYENNIISVLRRGKEDHRFVVKFGQCGGYQNCKHPVGYIGFYFAAANKETKKTFDFGLRDDPIFFLTDDCEVINIGNIFDNPELVEDLHENS